MHFGFIFLSLIICCKCEFLQVRRPSAVFSGSDWTDYSLVFRCGNGNLYWSLIHKHNIVGKDFRSETTWNKVDLPSGVETQSNPVAIEQSDNTTFVSFQSTNGQVYLSHLSTNLNFGKWVLIGGKLEYDAGSKVQGLDSVTMLDFSGKIYVFARSYANASHFYWSAVDKVKQVSSVWAMIGGSSAKLLTDASVAYNSFTELLEAFMVSTEGYLYRSWQLDHDRWSSWDKTGWSAPKTNHAPVVHAMDTNFFNGRLNVFIHGTDGKLHHIWQTTCDKVPNPWGWCTWSIWYNIGNQIPETSAGIANTLSIGNNIHLGIEIFVVGTNGHLYKLWQTERHGKWSDWQLVQDSKGYLISSLPAIVNDGTGWWSAYAFDTSTNVMVIQQNRSFILSPTTLVSDNRVTAKWHMPIDEASSTDWIAILPNGVSNHFYVDYVYVGGSQNPTSEVRPTGNVSFITYLPNGLYNVRYMVNKRYVSAISTTMTVTNAPSDAEWVQIFRGLFSGLNVKGVDIKHCVKDAKQIPKDFQTAFIKFKDRAIFNGLQKLGHAIGDVVNAIKDCGIEKAFIDRVKVFAEDLVNCVSKNNCVRFVVDIAKEVLVLYENIYEIYGDIVGASNCFKFKAFEQGGVNVGRVIAACIALPRDAEIIVKSVAP